MQNLAVRTLSGAVYASALVGLSLAGTNYLVILSIIFSFFALKEWGELKTEVNSFQYSFAPFLIVLIPLICLFETVNSDFLHLGSFIGIILYTIYIFSIAFSKEANAVNNLTHMGFGIVYIGLPLYLLPQIPVLYGQPQPWLLISIFILIWSSDSFAYLVGRFFGKKKLFERVSPKKTWEGFFGGLIFTLLASVVLSYYVGIIPIWAWLILSIITSISGTLGDLLESVFKRKYGVKDSGKFLPGHGGALDRIDSLLIVIPIAYFYLRILEPYLL